MALCTSTKVPAPIRWIRRAKRFMADTGERFNADGVGVETSAQAPALPRLAAPGTWITHQNGPLVG